MSRKLQDWELDVIYEVSQRSDAQKLIDEKNKTLFDMDRTRNPSSQKPSPAPKPKGDIRITKTDKTETISKQDNDKRKQQVERDYNKQIKQEILKTAHEKDDYEDFTIKQIDDMPEKDVSVLAEKGVDGYKAFQKQQELENNKNDIQKDNLTKFRESKDDMDITMSEKQSRELFGDRESEQKEMSPDDRLEDKNKHQDKDIENSLKMDSTKSDKTFDNADKFKFEFEKEEKDKDKDRDKTPDLSNDFE